MCVCVPRLVGKVSACNAGSFCVRLLGMLAIAQRMHLNISVRILAALHPSLQDALVREQAAQGALLQEKDAEIARLKRALAQRDTQIHLLVTAAQEVHEVSSVYVCLLVYVCVHSTVDLGPRSSLVSI